MAVANLTETYVQKLKVPEGKADIVVFDEKLSGFFVRKFATGKVSYGVKYSINGKSKKATLGPAVEGNLKTMRVEASEVWAKSRQGIDVFAKKKATAEEASRLKTLGELVPPYIALRETGDKKWKPLAPKTLLDVTRYLTKSWAPLHDKLITDITREMVEKQRDAIADKSGAVSGNRAHAALAGFFKWANKNGYVVGAKSTADIDSLIERSRERVLKEAELAVIWQACEDDDHGRIVKLLMLTGCRREEIGGLLWAEINVKTLIIENDDRTTTEIEYHAIELPAHRVKNKKPHIVPLSKAALAILQACERERHESRRYVFGGQGYVNWWFGKDQLDKRIADRLGKPMDHWTVHDLRRSFVTHMNELGIATPT